VFRPFRRGVLGALLSLAALLSFCLAPALASVPHEPRPRPGSLESRLSWGVQASGVGSAYRKGATGRGVIVAMVDTGIDPAATALFGHLSPQSIDLVPNRRHDTGDRRHGAQVATLLAARVDGAGTFGIAYGATLLSIRADRDGSCLRTCAFDADVLARAIDYAVAQNAQVIGLPLASGRAIPALEAALTRAVARGVVVVAAAGNNGGDEPVWPARYAAEPRFAPLMLVAGASSARGTLAPWSNRAGSTANRYVMAPGQHVIVGCGRRTCDLTSGTSYSVAYVAGAVALLLSRTLAPDGVAAAEALLFHADARRHAGSDPVVGRGRLDVAAALRSLG